MSMEVVFFPFVVAYSLSVRLEKAIFINVLQVQSTDTCLSCKISYIFWITFETHNTPHAEFAGMLLWYQDSVLLVQLWTIFPDVMWCCFIRKTRLYIYIPFPFVFLLDYIIIYSSVLTTGATIWVSSHSWWGELNLQMELFFLHVFVWWWVSHFLTRARNSESTGGN